MTNDHLNAETLNAFTDGELPPEEMQAVREHLTQCHRCALLALNNNQLKAETARAGHRYLPTSDVLARLSAQLRPQPAARKAIPFPTRRVAWSSIAAALVVGVSLFGLHGFHQTQAFEAELLDQHLAVLASTVNPQVISSDRHTVKPWFQGKLPFSFNLPEPGNLPLGTTLTGGDLAYLNGKQAALLLFMIGKHKASVFVTQKDAVAIPSTRKLNGFTEISANSAELTLTAVSDVNPDDLKALVQSLLKVQ